VTNTCNTDDCNLTAKYDGSCALHCEKSDYQSDRIKGVLEDFYDQLTEYILKEIFLRLDTDEADQELRIELQGGGIEWPKEKLEKIQERKNIYTNQIKSDEENSTLEALKQYPIVFQGIIFPDNKSRDYFDFFKLFKKFEGIHFDSSIINFGSFNLSNIKLFFQDCNFVDDWSIHSYAILEDVVSQSIFQNCTFQRSVTSVSMENARDVLTVEHHLFSDCKFNKQLALYRGTYTKSIFNNTDEYEQQISNLHLENCMFTGRFKLNSSEIGLLKIQNMEFKEKVELKYNTIKQAVIANVNFKKLFDAYMTTFKRFKISRSIFDDFTGFEKCQFGIKDSVGEKVTEFEYVTFLNFTNFRKAKFYNGLDIEHTNLKESPNFLNAEINFDNTNRETYRIIKHSFDKIGNQIEANKYFSYEMKKYKEELKESDSKTELFIYWVNEKISNFGASYVKPAFLMLASAVIYYLLIIGYECNLLYQFDDQINKYLNRFMSQVNLFAKGIPPYGRFLKEGMEFVTLLFHIFFLTCTWQFIVAVKRRTQR
jgi:hypothetical protein